MSPSWELKTRCSVIMINQDSSGSSREGYDFLEDGKKKSLEIKLLSPLLSDYFCGIEEFTSILLGSKGQEEHDSRDF